MFTLENLAIVLVIAVVFYNIRTIIGAIMLMLHRYQKPVVSIIKKEQIDEQILESMKPFEKLLHSFGFVYQSSLKATNMQVGLDLDHHMHYYYNPQNSVHAFINTEPNKGNLQSVLVDFTTFYESHNICITYDCFEYNFASNLKGFYIFDHYHGSFEKSYQSHLKDREIEKETIIQQCLSPKGCKDYANYAVEKIFEGYVDANIMRPISDNKYRFKFGVALFSFVSSFLKGYEKGFKALKLAKSSISENEATSREISEKQTLIRELETEPKKPKGENKIKWFFISLIAFGVLFFAIGIPLYTIAIIIVVLIVHELGHFLAMRYFNYHDTSIFFIPFFGAAATGKKEKTVPFEEFIISLAGPIPGILIGFAILMIFGTSSLTPMLFEYALISIVINYINLLPIFPLDGGRIVQGLLLARYPRGQFYFYVFSLILIGVSAFLLQDIVLAFFALILLFILKQNYLISTLLQTVFKEQNITSPKTKIIELLTEDRRYKNQSLVDKSSLAKQAIKIVYNQKPTVIMSSSGMVFYLLFLSLPIIVWFYITVFL